MFCASLPHTGRFWPVFAPGTGIMRKINAQPPPLLPDRPIGQKTDAHMYAAYGRSCALFAPAANSDGYLFVILVIFAFYFFILQFSYCELANIAFLPPPVL